MTPVTHRVETQTPSSDPNDAGAAVASRGAGARKGVGGACTVGKGVAVADAVLPSCGPFTIRIGARVPVG